MKNYKSQLVHSAEIIIQNHWSLEEIPNLEIQDIKAGFDGDCSLVIFPLVKVLKLNPEEIGQKIGEGLKKDFPQLISDFNVVKGFVNLTLSNELFQQIFISLENREIISKGENIMLEYSSPNTNKPLHLGHIRNNLLGSSVANILKEAGYGVTRTQIINDRGIHICKSMLAWKESGKGETPETTGLKGDKLVGNYYVAFDQAYKNEVAQGVERGLSEQEAKKQAPLMQRTQKMLQDWEQGDTEVHSLWQKMNRWVYAGFDQTYQRLGITFDQTQYESETYLLGKDIIERGLEKGIFFQKEDGSVWIDLQEDGMDQKLVLRGDGTSVYITQDLGTAVERFEKNDIQRLIYTVGNEQDYHFQVLFLILKKLGYTWANHLHHLSYGMVELPNGKMKSREGTVVDADDLMEGMYLTAKEKAEELGKLDGLSEDERNETYERIGIAALKYFILRVDPKKKILFNPEESIDFNGNTGPFILYTYARIQSLLSKAVDSKPVSKDYVPEAQEKALLLLLVQYKEVVEKAASSLSPAQIANYAYEVVKAYNAFYQSSPILNTEENVRSFRLNLSAKTAETIRDTMHLLGIQVVDRM